MKLPHNLYVWALKQKTNYRSQILPDEKIKKLESFSGWEWHIRHIHKKT